MAETFESALHTFRSFLQQNGYPTELAWLTPEQVIVRPGVLYIRLAVANSGVDSARQVFDWAAAQHRGVLFQAIAGNDRLTFCHAWLPRDDDESQRYQMPKTGVKMSVVTGTRRPVVHIMSNRVQWSFLRLLYRRHDALRNWLFNLE